MTQAAEITALCMQGTEAWWTSESVKVMGGTVSAAQLINRSAGSIYLCHRQSCWETVTAR